MLIMRKSKLIALSIVGTFDSVPAVAQDQIENPYAPCSRIEGDAARLECFDATYARETALAGARAERANNVRIEEFGLSAEQRRERKQDEGVPPAASAQTSEKVVSETEGNNESTLTDRVVEIFYDARRRDVILLENGQIWRARANRSFRGRIKAGWTAIIEKSWSGGYRMTFEERSGFISIERVR